MFPARGMAAGGAGSAVGPAGRAEPSASPPGRGVVLFARRFSNREVAPRRGGAIRPQAALQGQAGAPPQPGRPRRAPGAGPGAQQVTAGGRGTRAATGTAARHPHRFWEPDNAAAPRLRARWRCWRRAVNRSSSGRERARGGGEPRQGLPASGGLAAPLGPFRAESAPASAGSGLRPRLPATQKANWLRFREG